MKFEPKTEEQIEELDLLPDGIYEFSIYSAEDKQSKSGLPMIQLKLEIYGNLLGTKYIFDYLVSSNHPITQKKIRHFCYATGLEDLYELGEISSHHLMSKSGKLILGIEDSEKFRKKNKVIDYMAFSKTDPISFGKQNSDDKSLIDDDLPF